MKTISLSQGKEAIVDDADYDHLNQFKWSAQRIEKSGCVIYYAYRTVWSRQQPKTQKRIFMHRALMAAPTGQQVDHKNRNGLDNRRENLRICTPGDNQHNSGPRRGGSSQFKGVHWTRYGWSASIKPPTGTKHLGYFLHEEDAARAYDVEARKQYGEFAYCNFQH